MRNVVRLAVATLAVAAAGVLVSGTPAHAATCGGASGVSVVVDFHQLRSGGAQSACDAGGAGEYAAAQFTDVGHTLTYVQNEPFVCLVDGLGSPQCARTPPSDAYWSLWWSDGKSGTWTYASLGAASLKVPAGGSVALSWQKGNAQAPPRVAPATHSATPPTSHPTSRPSSQPTSGQSSHPTHGSATTPSSPASTTQATPSTSPTSSGPGKGTHGPRPSKAAGPHHGASQDSSDQAAGQMGAVTSGGGGSGSGGLPGWVAPVAVVLVFAVGGSIALLRRKSSGGA